MKNNNENIIKYFSGNMTDEEKLRFESELKNSDETKKEFEKIDSLLNNLKSIDEIEVNEVYFNNQIPRVRERIEALKKFRLVKRFYYLVPTAASVVVLLMFLFNTKTNFEMHYKEVANEVVKNISDNEVSEKYLSELEVDPSNSVLEENEVDLSVGIPAEIEANTEAISNYIDNSYHNDMYVSLSKLSDNDLEKIYNKLKSKNSR